MKIAVTGVSGLIGANVATAAIAQGHQVTGLAREGSDTASLHALGVAIERTDIREDRDRLRAIFSGADVVIHTAARFSYHHSAGALHDTAVGGSENVLLAAAEAAVGRVVLTSSSVVFGYATAPEALGDEGPIADPAGQPAYVASKIAQDRAAARLADRLGLELVLACPTVTIGKTASTLGPSNGMLLAYLSDTLRSTYPGGCNVVSAKDVGAAHVLLAEAGAPGQHYLLGSQNLAWSELHLELGRLAGVGGPHIELSPSLAWAAALYEEGLAALERRPPLSTRTQAEMLGRYYWYDDARARALGYDPMPSNQALLEAISWLVASSHVSRELRAQIRLAADVHHYRFREQAA